MLRKLMEFIYKSERFKIMALDCQEARGLPTDIPVLQKKEGFIEDQALRSVMHRCREGEDKEIRRRERLGDTCYEIQDQKRIVHYSWVTRRQRVLTYANCAVWLHSDDGWIYDCFTSPSHRGRALYPTVLRKISDDVRREQGGVVWIDVMESNQASLHGILKSGFVEVARFDRRVLFSHFVIYRHLTLLNPRLGLRLLTCPWSGDASMEFSWN